MDSVAYNKSLRRVAFVALLNLGYFGIEFAVAAAIGSVSLFADSIDFLEDTSLNLLIFIGLAWSARNRARLGMVLAGILLVPGLATLWTAWEKFAAPMPPAPIPLSLAGAGALVDIRPVEAQVRFASESGRCPKGNILAPRHA